MKDRKSQETIQRQYNYNNNSLHQSSKRILTGSVDTNSDRRIIFTNFNFNPSSNNHDTWHGQQSPSNLTSENIYKFHQNSTLKMTTFAEEVTQHLELFIKHLTDNNEVINEYNEEFLVDATIISLKAGGTIQSHLEETRARMVFYTYIREYKQQQFYKFMQNQQQSSPSTQ